MTDIETINQIAELFKEENIQLDSLRKTYRSKRQKVLDKWAAENARFMPGDFLKSDSFIIKVDKIRGGLTYRNTLYAVYYGPAYTTKLKPRKDGFNTSIYDDGREIIKLNK